MVFSTSVLLMISAFFHALGNALLKKMKFIEVGTFLSIFVATSIAYLYACYSGNSWSVSKEAILPLLLAGLCECSYFYTLSKSYRENDLGLAYAYIRGGAMIIVWPLSLSLLGEHFVWREVYGAGLIFIGLLAVNIQHKKSEKKFRPFWPSLTALSIAGYHMGYDLALTKGQLPPAITFAYAMTIAVPSYLLLIAKTHRKEFRPMLATWRNRTKVIKTGIVTALSFLIFLKALRTSGAAIGISLRNTSILWALIMSLAMGEKLSLRQIAGILVIGMGAILISL